MSDVAQPDLEEAPPAGPHLAVQLKNGMWQAIPRFAVMAMIEDPARPDKVIPVGLADVRLNRGEHNVMALELICPCRQAGCTRRLVLKGSWKGGHPQKFGDEVSKMAANLTRKK